MPMGQMQKTIKLNVGTSEVLWPYQVVDVIQQVMEVGEATHPHGSWEKVSVRDHLVHAEEHILKARNARATNKRKPETEDHLANAFARIMMALAIERGYGQTEFEAMVAEREAKRRG